MSQVYPHDYDQTIRVLAEAGIARNYPPNAELPCLTLEILASAATAAELSDYALEEVSPSAIAQLITLAKGNRIHAAESIGYYILTAMEKALLPRVTRDVQAEMAELRYRWRQDPPCDAIEGKRAQAGWEAA